MRWFLHRPAVLSRDAPGARHAVEIVRRDVLGGKDRLDGTRQRLSLVDRRDFGMGVGRAQEHGVQLLRQHDVMDITSATGEEASIFTTAKRYSDPIFGHCDVSSAFLCRSPPRLIKSREFVAARERIVMSAANCCPKPGYGATS